MADALTQQQRPFCASALWDTLDMMAASKTGQTVARDDLLTRRERRDLRRQAKLMATHPENDAIDAWIEAAYDWTEWK